jgi:hypothetical protein
VHHEFVATRRKVTALAVAFVLFVAPLAAMAVTSR